MKKNRRKQKIDTSSLLIVVGAAFLVATAGLVYTVFKNQQILIERQIAQTEDRIAQHDLDVKTKQMEIDKMLNRYLIQDQLSATRSTLKPIEISAMIHIKVAEVLAPDLVIADP